MTSLNPDQLTRSVGAPESVSLNPFALVGASVPTAVAIALLIPSNSEPLIGICAAIAGVLSLLLFKQYASKKASSMAYERSRWMDWTLRLVLSADLVLLVLHTYPWAKQLATGRC